MQLDLFEDGRDQKLRNDAVHALARHDAAAARAARTVLAEAYPEEDALVAIDVALSALDGLAEASRWRDHAALDAASCALDGAIASAARRLFGEAGAADWLLPLFAQGARRAEALPFDARHPDVHAAALWLAARNWMQAERSAAGIASWRRIPAPLGWMAEARARVRGLDDAWPLLVELAWIAPARFGALAKRLAEQPLERLRKDFDATFEGEGDARDLAWFPAWVLTQKTGLARLLAAAQPQNHAEPERAMRLLVEILGLERQGRQHELVPARRALRDLHGGLYAAYMATR